MTDCKKCKYARLIDVKKTSSLFKGMKLFLTTKGNTICTKEKVSSITIDANGDFVCSDYEEVEE